MVKPSTSEDLTIQVTKYLIEEHPHLSLKEKVRHVVDTCTHFSFEDLRKCNHPDICTNEIFVDGLCQYHHYKLLKYYGGTGKKR